MMFIRIKRLTAAGIAAVTLLAPVSVFSQAASLDVSEGVAGIGAIVRGSGLENKDQQLIVTGSKGSVYTQKVHPNADGTLVTSIPGSALQVSDDYTAVLGNLKDTFSVLPDSADAQTSHVYATPNGKSTDGRSQLLVTAILRDGYRNVKANYPLLAVGGKNTIVTPVSKQTDAKGVQTWTVVASGQATVTIVDPISGKTIGDTSDDTAIPSSLTAQLVSTAQGGDAAMRFDISTSGGGEENVRAPFTLTARAVDANGQTDETYTGRVRIDLGDPDADGPAEFNMETRNLGVKIISLAFTYFSPGRKTITLTDTKNPSVKGTLSIAVSGGTTGNSGKPQVVEPKYGAMVRPLFRIAGKTSALVDIEVIASDGTKIATGESDIDGIFDIKNVAFPEGTSQLIFTVQTNNGAQSLPIQVFQDITPPAIQSITIIPEVGKPGEEAYIRVLSENNLKEMRMTIGDETKLLPASDTGAYSTSLKAPDRPGDVTIVATATDEAGNTASMQTKWTIAAKEIPKVEGVTAETKKDGVLLKWKNVEAAIKGYKMYVALQSEPENYIYSLQTKAVTSALVKGLASGKVYVFRIAAEGSEGGEGPLSDPVDVSILGLRLRATPGQDSVLLEWVKPENLPLAQYILRYGTLEGYTERRDLNGQLRAYNVRDLIAGVTYEFQLEAFAVNGKIVDELTSTVRATVGGDGFHPGPSDPANGYTDDPYVNAPSTSGVGLPMPVVYATLITAILAGLLVRSQLKQRKMAQAFMRMMDQRYKA